MKVGNIPAVKLREETTSVTPSLDVKILLASIVIDFLMMCYWRGRMIFLIVVTRITPEKLTDKLDASLTELKQFSNINQIFICKIPARFDFQSINHQVSQFNQLLFEPFSDTEEFLNVFETILSEFRFCHHDGLHMSNFGIVPDHVTFLNQVT